MALPVVRPQLYPAPLAFAPVVDVPAANDAVALLPLNPAALPAGPNAMQRNVRTAQQWLEPFMPQPERLTAHRAIKNYVNVLSSGAPATGDINSVLQALRVDSSPLERGVVGPTGASATASFSVLGPIFGVYGFAAGAKIIHNARKASAYLARLNHELKELETRLQALETASADDPALVNTIAELKQRIFVLQEFRRGVQMSVSEQRFNMTFPGVVQLTASSLILTLAVDMAPQLGGAAGLLPAAATMTFGVVASSVLGVYAAGSFAKNGYELVRNWNVPRLQATDGDSLLLQQYKKRYNSRIKAQRAFYGLNTASWGLYVAGAGVLIAAIATSAASHGAPVAMVIIGALGPVIWDAIWGKEFAPHNALTPHIDRNYLGTVEKRAHLWKLLKDERGQLERAMKAAMRSLPRGYKAKPILWHRFPRELRYKYFWQFMPSKMFKGGTRRFAQWCINDAKRVDPIVLGQMKTYTDAEIAYLRDKLVARTAEVTLRIVEFSRARQEVHESDNDTLRALLMQDGLALQNDELKLAAMQALREDIDSIDLKHVHEANEHTAHWNRLRLEYLAIHGLLDNFIDKDDLLIHPRWFTYQSARGLTPGHRFAKISNKQLTYTGLKELSQRGFTPKQEERFIQAVADLKSNTYEIATVFSIERSVQKKAKKEAKKEAKAEAKATARLQNKQQKALAPPKPA